MDEQRTRRYGQPCQTDVQTNLNNNEINQGAGEGVLSSIIHRLTPESLPEGCSETGISYLKMYRFLGETIAMPQMETPYIYILLDGAVRFYTPSGILDYVAGQYSVSEIDTPMSGHVLGRSARSDVLALSVSFTLHDVVSVVLDLEGNLAEQIVRGEIAEEDKSRADEQVLSVTDRILAMRGDAVQLAYMAKHLREEMIFYILCGSCGQQFLQSVIRIQQADEIYEVNSWIKKNFRNSFTVEELAEQKNMSVSLFHQKFKNAVGMGPLQCQKRLRLTEARRLMLDENKNVTEAAMEVGYESVSQFIRDYRKMFGQSPKEDISKLRGQLKEQVIFQEKQARK